MHCLYQIRCLISHTLPLEAGQHCSCFQKSCHEDVMIFILKCIHICVFVVLEFNGIKTSSVAVQGLPGYSVPFQTWWSLLQTNDRAKQGTHSRACHCWDLQSFSKTIVLHSPCKVSIHTKLAMNVSEIFRGCWVLFVFMSD